MQWTCTRGETHDYVQLHRDMLVIGRHHGSGITDHGTSCSFERFLAGDFQPLVAERFGEETLQIIIAAVQARLDLSGENHE